MQKNLSSNSTSLEPMADYWYTSFLWREEQSIINPGCRQCNNKNVPLFTTWCLHTLLNTMPLPSSVQHLWGRDMLKIPGNSSPKANKGASILLCYKRDFVICNFAVSVKFIKKYIECLPGIPKCFVISIISL